MVTSNAACRSCPLMPGRFEHCCADYGKQEAWCARQSREDILRRSVSCFFEGGAIIANKCIPKSSCPGTPQACTGSSDRLGNSLCGAKTSVFARTVFPLGQQGKLSCQKWKLHGVSPHWRLAGSHTPDRGSVKGKAVLGLRKALIPA